MLIRVLFNNEILCTIVQSHVRKKEKMFRNIFFSRNFNLWTFLHCKKIAAVQVNAAGIPCEDP